MEFVDGVDFLSYVRADRESVDDESTTDPGIDALSSFKKDLPRTDAIVSPAFQNSTASLNELKYGTLARRVGILPEGPSSHRG